MLARETTYPSCRLIDPYPKLRPLKSETVSPFLLRSNYPNQAPYPDVHQRLDDNKVTQFLDHILGFGK